MQNERYRERGLLPIWSDRTVDWETRRRQLLEILQREEYGFFPCEADEISFAEDAPANFCAGKVSRSRVEVTARF